MIGSMAEAAKLSQTESIWVVAPNIAAGEWEPFRLGQAEAKKFLLDFRKAPRATAAGPQFKETSWLKPLRPR